MSTITNQTLAVSKKILSRLAIKPMRQHELCEQTIRDSVSIKKTITVFYWLKNQGFIQKENQGYCSPFRLTKKGKFFYEAITLEENHT